MNKLRVVSLAYFPAPLFKEHLVLQNSVVHHPATWIVNLVRALGVRSDIELHVVAESGSVAFDQDIVIDGVSYHFIKSPSTLNLATMYYLNVKRLVKKVETLRPALVHAHGCEGSIGLAGVWSGYPCLVSIQGLLSQIAETDRKWFGHASLRTRLLALNERRVLKRAKYVGSRTEYANQYIKQVNPKTEVFYAPEVMADVFFTVDPSLLERTIVYVGSVIPRKDIYTLIQAFGRVRKGISGCRLSIVGSGPEAYIANLRNDIVKLGLGGSVEFHGFLDTDSIARLFARCSLFTLSSLIENSPNSLAEAMCAGLPVVAANVGGVPSMVEEGVTGYLVPPRDPEAMARAICALLLDGNLRKKMGAAARERAIARHSPGVVAEQMVKIYRTIVNREQRKATH